MTMLEADKSIRKLLILAAGISGTVQAVLWTTLSILSILCYNDIIENGDEETYSYLLYETFHNSEFNIINATNYTKPVEITITAKSLNYIMYLYTIFSFFWVLVSSLLIWEMVQDKWRYVIVTMKGWVGITVTISALDLVVVCLLLLDCYNVFNEIKITTAHPLAMIYQAVYGIVISLAARGYVLWFINIALIITLVRFVTQMQKEERPVRLSVIDAFASGVPRFDTGRTNEGFIHEDGDLRSERPSLYPLSSLSLASSDNVRFSRPLYDYNPPNRFETSKDAETQYSRQNTTVSDFKFNTAEPPKFERHAKIGKSNGGRRTPPQNVTIPRVPYIPAPDYTPPSSPKSQPKSVLRSNSQTRYMY